MTYSRCSLSHLILLRGPLVIIYTITVKSLKNLNITTIKAVEIKSAVNKIFTVSQIAFLDRKSYIGNCLRNKWKFKYRWKVNFVIILVKFIFSHKEISLKINFMKFLDRRSTYRLYFAFLKLLMFKYQYIY